EKSNGTDGAGDTEGRRKQEVAASDRPRDRGPIDPGSCCRGPAAGWRNYTGARVMSENLAMAAVDAADLMAGEGGHSPHPHHHAHHGQGGGGGGGGGLGGFLSGLRFLFGGGPITIQLNELFNFGGNAAQGQFNGPVLFGA